MFFTPGENMLFLLLQQGATVKCCWLLKKKCKSSVNILDYFCQIATKGFKYTYLHLPSCWWNCISASQYRVNIYSDNGKLKPSCYIFCQSCLRIRRWWEFFSPLSSLSRLSETIPLHLLICFSFILCPSTILLFVVKRRKVFSFDMLAHLRGLQLKCYHGNSMTPHHLK